MIFSQATWTLGVCIGTGLFGAIWIAVDIYRLRAAYTQNVSQKGEQHTVVTGIQKDKIFGSIVGVTLSIVALVPVLRYMLLQLS